MSCHFESGQEGGRRSTDTCPGNQEAPAKPLLFFHPLWGPNDTAESYASFPLLEKLKRKFHPEYLWLFPLWGSKQSERDKTWCFSWHHWMAVSRLTSVPPTTPFRSCHNGVAFPYKVSFQFTNYTLMIGSTIRTVFWRQESISWCMWARLAIANYSSQALITYHIWG